MIYELLPAFFTLFVIIDPIGLVPIFLALTAEASDAHRRRMAIQGCVIAFGILFLFAVFGDNLLGAMGISMAAFRLAGGVLLFLIALEMVFEKRTQRRNERAEELNGDDSHADQPKKSSEVNDDIAAFPLAIPFVAGPGAIATIILLMGKAEGDIAWQMGVIGIIALTVLITLLMFLVSAKLAHRIPPALITVTTRVLGILLAALSIQYVIDGIDQAFGPFVH